MAVKKTASATKAKAADAPAPKKTTDGAKGAVKTETASKTTAAAPKSAATAPKAATAAPKKASPAALKLTSTQSDLLSRIGGAGEPGYRSEKKVEFRTIEALRERKLIKRGAKHKESGNFHYQISNAGKKFLDTNASAPAAATPPGGGNA